MLPLADGSVGVFTPAAFKARVQYFTATDAERVLWANALNRVVAALDDDCDSGGVVRTALSSPGLQAVLNVRAMAHGHVTDLLASVFHPSWKDLEELQWAGSTKSGG